MADLVNHPDEIRVVSSRWGKGATDINRYLELDGYKATRKALERAGVPGSGVEAIALDTTGSSVVPVGPGLEPLDSYYLWCDHRAKAEAQHQQVHQR